MWTTISYKEAVENNQIVRIYDDSTEKSFVEENDARDYAGYLLGKYGNFIDIYEKFPLALGELDINELKKQDALDKLSQEEKQILGLNE